MLMPVLPLDAAGVCVPLGCGRGILHHLGWRLVVQVCTTPTTRDVLGCGVVNEWLR